CKRIRESKNLSSVNEGTSGMSSLMLRNRRLPPVPS
ncbi:hypothetical protein V3C99_008861, partial [Haemonchus contortus]